MQGSAVQTTRTTCAGLPRPPWSEIVGIGQAFGQELARSSSRSDSTTSTARASGCGGDGAVIVDADTTMHRRGSGALAPPARRRGATGCGSGTTTPGLRVHGSLARTCTSRAARPVRPAKTPSSGRFLPACSFPLLSYFQSRSNWLQLASVFKCVLGGPRPVGASRGGMGRADLL